MGAVEFYVLTLAVFGCISAIEALGFNLQFGVAGIINLAFILLVAVGAYGTAVATVGAPAAYSGETYVGGLHLPFPLNLLVGVGCSLAVGMLLGLTALRRFRHDYLALGLVALAQGAQIFAESDIHLLDGVTGMTGVAGPWENSLSQGGFALVFLAIAAAGLVLAYVIVWRITRSPLGRAVRAIRDDEIGVQALGKGTWRLKFVAFTVGAGLGGLAGGLTVLYTGGWNPDAWLPTESAVLLAAIIVGGRGRNVGAVAGAFVIMVLAAQSGTFLPQIGSAQLLPALQTAAIAVIVLAFLWWRPQGLFPERKDRYAETPSLSKRPVHDSALGQD